MHKNNSKGICYGGFYRCGLCKKYGHYEINIFCTISWKANQHFVVALSTTQVEYIFLVEGENEVIYMVQGCDWGARN
jgi:hypothetical protein